MKPFATKISAARGVSAGRSLKNLLRLGVAGSLLVMGLSGCSTITKEPPEKRFMKALQCLAPGALIGGGLGAINDGETVAIGAIGGSMINLLVCNVLDETADADGDGVTNNLDRCPGTPAGYTVDAHGCPLDSDGDGVTDALDECPDTPAGFKVDDKGCPVDSDGDGVLNGLDKCPDTPAGSKVDRTGCPEVGQELAVLMGIEFNFDSSEIRHESRFILSNVIQTLASNPDIKVNIIGHTDSIGTEEYNQKLSERRAAAVREYLIQQGIDEGRMTTEGRGEKEPVAPNMLRADRQKNRRVVFMVTDK